MRINLILSKYLEVCKEISCPLAWSWISYELGSGDSKSSDRINWPFILLIQRILNFWVSFCYLCVLLSSLHCCNKTLTTSNPERAGFISSPGFQFIIRENQSHAETWRPKPKQKECGCRPWLAHPAFFYSPWPPTQGWHCPRWVQLSHINQQLRNSPQRYAHKLIWWKQFLTEIPSFRVCLDSHQADRN